MWWSQAVTTTDTVVNKPVCPAFCACVVLCGVLCLQASVNGHAKVVELLLGGGADPLLQNKEGRSAVDMAKTPELAQQLRAHSTQGSS